MKARKLRLDKLLVDRGLAPSRERAHALIMAGRILADDQKIAKPGAMVAEDAALRRLGEDERYVSRAGRKLEAALEQWGIALTGRYCADIGASTGGFTDCMLQHGAASVTAVDTGYGQIAQKLRDDSRVILLERTNARHLAPGALSRDISFFAMDVSFISATLVLAPVLRAIRPAGSATEQSQPLEAVVLVKPQFEAGREHVGKGGIVRDPAAHRMAIERVRRAVASIEGREMETMESPITGVEGNREFLLHAVWPDERGFRGIVTP